MTLPVGARSVSAMLHRPADSSAQPVIQTTGLTKRYGSTLALDRLDLAIHPGEVYGFLGPNGAGKTTTIRLLLGLHRATAGGAELAGLHGAADSVVAVSSLWPLLGPALGAPRWLIDLSPFAHLGLAPAHAFRLAPVVVTGS
jgi:hypothetical protein